MNGIDTVLELHDGLVACLTRIARIKCQYVCLIPKQYLIRVTQGGLACGGVDIANIQRHNKVPTIHTDRKCGCNSISILFEDKRGMEEKGGGRGKREEGEE